MNLLERRINARHNYLDSGVVQKFLYPAEFNKSMLDGSPNINLKETLSSGQVFRYWLYDDKEWYLINQRDTFFLARQEKSTVAVKGASKEFITNFFRLDEAIPNFDDKRVRDAAKKYPNLRVIRQDPWQCLVTFILSQNSNIPRIKKMVENLCTTYGKKVKVFGKTYHSFPGPGTFDGRIHTLGLGYRVEYLTGLADKRIDFGRLSKKNYPEAKNELIKIKGVGPKVADCVLLFSLGFDNAFPIDVHIKRTLEKNYFNGKTMTQKELTAFVCSHFGPKAGIAQQYLFHAERMENGKHF